MSPHTSRTRKLAVVAAVLASAGVIAPSAQAQNASATLSAGELEWIAPGPTGVAFDAVVLDGQNKTTTKSQTFNVRDARGSGAGWKITGSSTQFTDGTKTLPTDSVTMQSAPGAPICISGSTCTVATGNDVTYPYTLPGDGSTTKMYSAALDSGLGEQSITGTWQLLVPASAKAGNYTSTWTITLATGP